MAKFRIKKGDTVKVLAGKERGKTAKVERVIRKKSAVILEGLNIVKRHVKPKREGQKGQIVGAAMPIHISNVAMVEEKKKIKAKTETKAQ